MIQNQKHHNKTKNEIKITTININTHITRKQIQTHKKNKYAQPNIHSATNHKPKHTQRQPQTKHKKPEPLLHPSSTQYLPSVIYLNMLASHTLAQDHFGGTGFLHTV